MKTTEVEMLGPETPGGSAMELVAAGGTLVKLENTTQMQVAVQRPRNEDKVLSAALAELERYPSMADEAIYSKPVGKDPDTSAMKYVEGLSIRAAESLANRWTNSAYACDIVNEDQMTITIAAIFMDYEGNTRHVVQRRVSKFYKKKGSTMIAQYSPDRLDVVVAAAMSKALREVILRSLPAGLKKEYEHKAYRVLEMQPLEQRQIAIVARFKEVGIKKDALEVHAGKKIELLTADDLKVYTGLLNAIRDGEISAEDALGIKKEDKPTETAKPGITVAGPGDGKSPDSRTEKDPVPATPPVAPATPVVAEEREPGADEGEDEGLSPDQKGGATPDTASGQPPFPEAEKPKVGTTQLSGPAQSALFLINGAQTPIEVDIAWKEQVVKNKNIPANEKMALQKVKDDKIAALQAR